MRDACAPRARLLLGEQRRGALRYSSGTAIIGNITLRLPCTAARSSARICTRNTSGRASDRRMPRRPRNGLLSSTVKPAPACRRRHRRCGSSPACRRPIRAPCGRRDTASPRRAASLPNRNSVRIRPTPSQVAMSMRVDIGRIGDVDHARATGVPSAVTAGFAEIASACVAARRRRRCERRGTRSISAVEGASTMPPCSASSRAAPAIAVGGSAPRPTTIGTPRARASMATWLAGLPASSAMPPPCSSRSRGSASARCRRRAGSRLAAAADLAVAGQRAQHRSRMSLQVGGAGAEIVVVGRLIAGDLRLERLPPGRVGRRARGDRGEGRAGRHRPPAWRAGTRGCRRLAVAPSRSARRARADGRVDRGLRARPSRSAAVALAA